LVVPVNEEEKRFLDRASEEIWSRIPDRDPVKFAYVASNWLAVKHQYSTILAKHIGEGDPVVRWMRSSEGGHCEYFSAALVLLCRSAGIPARVVTGFHGGNWNGFENYFMVKNSDAHAWVEVFDGEAYWVRIDPTPGGNQKIVNLNEAAVHVDSFVDSSVTAYLDSLRILWYRRVVNFDNEDQVELVNGLSAAGHAFVSRVRNKIDRLATGIRDVARDPFNQEQLALFGLAFGFLLVGFLCIRIILSRMRSREYFKFFGTRKRKRVKQLKARVMAGRMLSRYQSRLRDANASEMIQTSIDELMLIRFGQVERWPTVNLVLKRARKLIKTI
jgi:protein-glutamine gamma-glutamyltransferase